MRETVMVTGAAGFIGFHLSLRLLQEGYDVVGVDNMNAYYDTRLKDSRLELLRPHARFSFVRGDIADMDALRELFFRARPSIVVNLAAQAGVRYSLTNPQVYVNSNVYGFVNVLECCRNFHVKHLVFASSSSVYGRNAKVPFSTEDSVDHPVSVYAATKRANELLAHTYAHLYSLPCTGLRFFTVYGPWGRPDMAYYTFTRSIYEDRIIDVYNAGNHKRDFTYVDDVVDGLHRLLQRIPQPDPTWGTHQPDPGSSYAPYRIYNIGNHRPVDLMYFIETLERLTGRTAQKRMVSAQPGDVPETFADVSSLMRDTGFAPTTPIEVGLAHFVNWYRTYHGV